MIKSSTYSFACIDTFRPQTRSAMWKTNNMWLLSTSMSLAGISRPNNTSRRPTSNQNKWTMFMSSKFHEKLIIFSFHHSRIRRFTSFIICGISVSFCGTYTLCECHGNIDSIDTPNHDVDLLDTRREGKIRKRSLLSDYRFEIDIEICVHAMSIGWINRPFEGVCVAAIGVCCTGHKCISIVSSEYSCMEIPWNRASTVYRSNNQQ